MGAVADPWRPDPEQGVFETLLVVDGRPVELDAHLARLESSLGQLFPDHDPSLLDVPVERDPYGHPHPGTSAALSDGGPPSSMRITVAPTGEARLRVWTSTRELDRGVVFDPKPVALHSFPLAGGLGAHKWADRSLLDAAQADLPQGALPLITDRDGAVLEASRANLFAVRDGALLTPPVDGRILPGVTRARVIEIAVKAGLEVAEASLYREDLRRAEEVFLTGSVRGLERVHSLDRTTLTARGDIAMNLRRELLRSWTAAKVG